VSVEKARGIAALRSVPDLALISPGKSPKVKDDREIRS
jgi:hypothetical protein